MRFRELKELVQDFMLDLNTGVVIMIMVTIGGAVFVTLGVIASMWQAIVYGGVMVVLGIYGAVKIGRLL